MCTASGRLYEPTATAAESPSLRSQNLPMQSHFMNQDNQSPSPAFPLQPPRDSDSHSSPENKCEHVFITLIRATDVASSLRRMPVGFHVIVEVGGRIIQTSNKPMTTLSTEKDAVEWAEEILLPSDQSSSISLSVYASFELGPRLGNEELLRQFKITVGEVFDHRNEKLQLVHFTAEKGDILQSCLSLCIITERRICDPNESCPKPDLPEPREMNAVEQLTANESHHALSRYRQRQNQMDLDNLNRSILMREEVVCLSPDGHPHKPPCLNALGISLLSRFERLGDLADLNRSISLIEEAVCLSPDGHPNKLAYLHGLGYSFSCHFERLRDLGDLNRSISMAEEAVCLTPDGHPSKSIHLNNLGNSLCRRFERLGDFGDLNRSISMAEEAVCLTPNGHPCKPPRLNNLGNSLCRRFEHLGDLGDLNKSISMKEEAVCLSSDGDPDKLAYLNDLGSSLLSRFERLGDLADLNRSISMKEEAVCLTPNGHPHKPVWSSVAP